MISVIIPVYNVEKYLDKCINSIVSQTYQDTEIILVNDGSTDSSVKICEAWKKKDKRIRIVNKENGGLADARNTGLEVAKGEYVAFVDSDDYIENDMFELLYRELKEDESDIVICGINYVTDKEVIKISCLQEKTIYEKERHIELYLSTNIFNASACNKLYKMELFENIRFPKGKKFEDMAIMPFLFDKAKRVSHIGVAKYNYIYRKGSITKSPFSKKDFDLIEIEYEIANYFRMRQKLYDYAYRNIIFSYFACIDKIIAHQCEKEFNSELKICAKNIKSQAGKIMFCKTIESKYKLKTICLFMGIELYTYIMKKKLKIK